MTRSAKLMTVYCNGKNCKRSITISMHTDQQFEDELLSAGWRHLIEKQPHRDAVAVDLCPDCARKSR